MNQRDLAGNYLTGFMKRRWRAFVVALVLLVAVRSAASGVSEENLKALAEGNTGFALELYHKIRVADGNLFLSQYSISAALAMTYAGARGETASQMAKVLDLALPQDELNPAFSDLQGQLSALQEKGDIQLSVANSLWPQAGYPLLSSYVSLVKRYYGVTVTPLDYRSDKETARRRINAWVEEQTRNRIKDLIQPGMLDPSTRLVLANAIYFKGNWSTAFKREATKDIPFYRLAGEPVQVPTMVQREQFGHEDHAVRACHASLAIHHALTDYGEKQKKTCGIDFEMGIGLDSGPVVVGAIGDDVPMESAAQPGCIFVSGHVRDL